MDLVGVFHLERVIRLGKMGAIFHGGLMQGDVAPGDLLAFDLHGQEAKREIAAVEVAGHLPGGKYRLDLHILFHGKDNKLFRPEAIPTGQIMIYRQ